MIRVFVSYSHEDLKICDAVCASLRRAGLDPISDKNLQAGLGFTEQIQTGITHAHVFMPILTPQSHARGWVHQEVGFAVALKVPCFPVCVGKLPDGMIGGGQGLVVREDLGGLDASLSHERFKTIVERAGRPQTQGPPCHVAYEPASRARALQTYADEAFEILGPRRVRIGGGLSAFSLPDEESDHPKWTAAYGNRPRDDEAYQLIRNEQHALKRHVVEGGLSAVFYIGLDLDAQRGVGATRTRLCLLHAFLSSPAVRGAPTQIAVVTDHAPEVRLAVGDWFFSESLAARAVRGIVHTTFITHAPTASRRLEEFDSRLAATLRDQDIKPEDSLSRALELIAARIEKLPPHPAWSCT